MIQVTATMRILVAIEPVDLSLTFAVHGHFRRASQRILFAFNGGIPETGQMKTLPLF